MKRLNLALMAAVLAVAGVGGRAQTLTRIELDAVPGMVNRTRVKLPIPPASIARLRFGRPGPQE